jgi:hypothetical protein
MCRRFEGSKVPGFQGSKTTAPDRFASRVRQASATERG